MGSWFHRRPVAGVLAVIALTGLLVQTTASPQAKAEPVSPSVVGADLVDPASGFWGMYGNNNLVEKFYEWDASGRFWYMASNGQPRFVSASGGYTAANLSGLPADHVVEPANGMIEYATGDLFIEHYPPTGGDFFLSKLDSAGSVLWTRTGEVVKGGGIGLLGATPSGDLLEWYPGSPLQTLTAINPSTGTTDWSVPVSERQFNNFDGGFVAIGFGNDVTYYSTSGVAGASFTAAVPPPNAGWEYWKTGADGDTWLMTRPLSGASCSLTNVQVIQLASGAGPVLLDMESRLGFCPTTILPAPDRTAILLGNDAVGHPMAGKIDITGNVLWSNAISSLQTYMTSASVDDNGNLVAVAAGAVSRDTCAAVVVTGCSEGVYSLVSGSSGQVLATQTVDTGYQPANIIDAFGGDWSYSDGIIFDQMMEGVIRVSLPGLGRPYPASRYRVGPSDASHSLALVDWSASVTNSAAGFYVIEEQMTVQGDRPIASNADFQQGRPTGDLNFRCFDPPGSTGNGGSSGSVFPLAEDLISIVGDVRTYRRVFSGIGQFAGECRGESLLLRDLTGTVWADFGTPAELEASGFQRTWSVGSGFTRSVEMRLSYSQAGGWLHDVTLVGFPPGSDATIACYRAAWQRGSI